MNRKAKGTRQERRSMKMFEAAGYHVTRAAGSLGMFDFIAIGPTDIVLCQVKCNRDAPPHEREAIEMFKCPPNCRKIIQIWKDYARTPIVKEY